MATNFPTSLDTFVNPASTDNLATVNHAQQHDNINDSVAALEAKVGINGSAVTSSLDYKIANFVASGLTMPAFRRGPAATATCDPSFVTNTAVAFASGNMYLTFFTAAVSFTTTQVQYIVGTATTTETAGTGIGLFSVDASDNGTLIASVASTTLFAATGTQTGTWAASTAIAAGSRYALGWVWNGTGSCNLYGLPVPRADTGLGTTPRFMGFKTATSIASFTAASLSLPTNSLFYAIVS